MLHVVSSMATGGLLLELAGAWRERGGADVAVEAVGGVDAARRVRAGERFDVAVLAADVIDRLAAEGAIVAGSRVDVVRSSVAIAVRRGAAPPAIGSEAALREAVLGARAVGISTGPSGVALRALFARWGIDDALRARLAEAPPGMPVGRLVASGEVELGFQQLSELMHVDGIDVVGPMPPGVEIVTVFSGGICTASTQREAARALLDFLRSPATVDAKRRHGHAPA